MELPNPNDWKVFAEKDPFNDNFVEGRICTNQGNAYGALYIEKVNDQKCSQLIYCTPKLHYPFDKNGNWHFPTARKICRYEKLDGTNIFGYRYKDSKDQQYTSFKTRLTPFVRESRFGPFYSMVCEIFKQKPELKRLPEMLGRNLSFELWGARNPHLVKYDEPLQLTLLFARDGEGVIPPEVLDIDQSIAAPKNGEIDRDYVYNYQQIQKEIDGGLKEQDDNMYAGREGEIWYVQDDRTGKWILYKLKPETIEKIHWSAGGIGKNIIRATCHNAFENWEDPTPEQVKELLLEEFKEPEVEGVHYMIPEVLKEVKDVHLFKERVLIEYNKLGINIVEDKKQVMRELSTRFESKQMRKVYGVIVAEVVK